MIGVLILVVSREALSQHMRHSNGEEARPDLCSHSLAGVPNVVPQSALVAKNGQGVKLAWLGETLHETRWQECETRETRRKR